MSDQNKKYESVLVGWADEPSYNDNGELMGWSSVSPFRTINAHKLFPSSHLGPRSRSRRGGGCLVR